MFPSAYLLLFLGQIPGLQQIPGTAPEQVMKVKYDEAGLTLGWNDAEDRIQGAVSPAEPRVGRPMQVSVHVGTDQGADFDGPVTLSLRPYRQAELVEGEPLGLKPMQDGPPPMVVTVTRGKAGCRPGPGTSSPRWRSSPRWASACGCCSRRTATPPAERRRHEGGEAHL